MTPRLHPRQMFLIEEAVPELPRRSVILDYFAGAGGASTGIEQALGRSPDVAINHCEHAVQVHALNHPETHHVRVDVWDVDPRLHLPPGTVDLAWFSPDCRHFSRAKGKRPVAKSVRGLAWIVCRVAGKRRPRVIVLENVQEFRSWGPVRKVRTGKRKGERHPVKSKKGQTFRKFVAQLEALGYVVEHRVLNAADYGAPTARERLVLIARCDGAPIVWPEPSHGPGRPLPYRTAAECIDWTISVPSIFGRKRPLAPATLRRIAAGVVKFVLACPRPFLVQVNHGRDLDRSRDLDRPMPTIASHNGFAVVVPSLIHCGNGERKAKGKQKAQKPRVKDIQAPLGTVVGTKKHALVVAFIAKHFKGATGSALDQPLATVTARDHNALVACHVTKFFGTSTGAPLDAPAPTVTGQGGHLGLVAAFLTKFYKGKDNGQKVNEPLHTIPTRDRFGLVTVQIDGEDYAVADIGMRMLEPRELARAQGFADSFQLVGTKTDQTARIGNSVPPPLARAVVSALFPEATDNLRRAAE